MACLAYLIALSRDDRITQTDLHLFPFNSEEALSEVHCNTVPSA